MEDKESLPAHPISKLSWDSLDFKGHAAILGYFIEAVGLFLALFPGLINILALKIILIAIVVLVAMGSLAWSHIKPNLSSVWGRLADYPLLHELSASQTSDLQSLRNHTLQILPSNNPTDPPSNSLEEYAEQLKQYIVSLATEALYKQTFVINRQSLDRDRDEDTDNLVIVLADENKLLKEGDEVVVVDTHDFYEMGKFEVTEHKTGEAYAVGRSTEVDSLWIGGLRKPGNRTEVVKKIAISLKQEEANND
jgi:hypothetical protein